MINFIGCFPNLATTETEDLVCVRPNTSHAIDLYRVLLMDSVLFWTLGIFFSPSIFHLGFIVLLSELLQLSVTSGSVQPLFSSCCRQMMLMGFHTCLFLDLFLQRPLQKNTIYYVWKEQVPIGKYTSGCHDGGKMIRVWVFLGSLYQSRKLSKHFMYVFMLCLCWCSLCYLPILEQHTQLILRFTFTPYLALLPKLGASIHLFSLVIIYIICAHMCVHYSVSMA